MCRPGRGQSVAQGFEVGKVGPGIAGPVESFQHLQGGIKQVGHGPVAAILQARSVERADLAVEIMEILEIANARQRVLHAQAPHIVAVRGDPEKRWLLVVEHRAQRRISACDPGAPFMYSTGNSQRIGLNNSCECSAVPVRHPEKGMGSNLLISIGDKVHCTAPQSTVTAPNQTKEVQAIMRLHRGVRHSATTRKTL